MTNYYDLNEIKTAIRNDIEKHEAFLHAWENVSFPTKKDGSAFKQIQKNISGATYYMESWAMQPGEYKIRVNARCNCAGYISDEINAHNLVRYLKDENKKAKTQNYMQKIPYLEQIYMFDIEDIKEAIQDRINYHKKTITAHKKQLEVATAAYNAFAEQFKKAVNELAKNTDKSENSTLYNAIFDTVTKRYPYI
jgi:hypothetical protein